MTQKLIPVVKGYKATDKDMKCRGFQFELDKVFEHKGKLEMCKSGFHFCVYPSGVWAYYNNDDVRVFEVEAYDVLDRKESCGIAIKMVAKKIKFIREIKFKKWNNTGKCNAGDYNAGYGNAGDWNAGNWNAGNYNTGHGNATNYSSGFFNDTLEKVRVFNKVTKYTYDQFCKKFPEYLDLCQELLKDAPIDFNKYKNIPNITEEKLRNLHKKFIMARNKGE